MGINGNFTLFQPSGGGSSSAFSFSYRSVTTTDSATTSDYTLGLSGASFTETLYTTTGNNGRIIVLTHLGTSLSQVYTIATTGGATIGSIASGSYALYTNGESLTLQCDETNNRWVILDHRTDTRNTSWTPSFDAGLGTVVLNNAYWRRSGQFLIGFVTAKAGTVTTSTGGITIPSGAVIDTAYLTITNNTTGSVGMKVGTFGANTSSGIGNIVLAPGTNTSKVYFSSNNATGTGLITPATSVSTTVMGSNSPFSIQFEVPIVGFQP